MNLGLEVQQLFFIAKQARCMVTELEDIFFTLLEVLFCKHIF